MKRGLMREVLKTVISLFPVILVRKNMGKYLKAVTNVKPVIFPQTPQISKNCYSLSKTCYFLSQDMENKKKTAFNYFMTVEQVVMWRSLLLQAGASKVAHNRPQTFSTVLPGYPNQPRIDFL